MNPEMRPIYPWIMTFWINFPFKRQFKHFQVIVISTIFCFSSVYGELMHIVIIQITFLIFI